MAKKILWSSVFLSLLAALFFWIVSSGLIKDQETQQMAKRWSENGGVAQISCFFSVDLDITPDRIEEIRYNIDRKLQEASIVQESANPGARLWADAYSAHGSITVKSDMGSITTSAIGIGGDFFYFHPLKLLEGAFFSGNDLMQDYCVLDEEAAWRLFGSNDIDGQIVFISGIPHVVAGVIEREQGRMENAAGLDSSLIYVSYDSLNRYGTHSGINHYEVVMPDPVKGFAEDCVKSLFGIDEQRADIINNTSRFELLNRIQLIRTFGTRSMNSKAIIYPYWENLARGTEDILLIWTLFMILFFVYPMMVIVIKLIIWWKHRTWNINSIWNKLRGGRFYERKRV